MVVFFSLTSQQPILDLSVYAHQGQNKCIFYKDGSLQQNSRIQTWPALSMPRCSLALPSLRTPISHCAYLCVCVCADMPLTTKYETSTPDLYSVPTKSASLTQVLRRYMSINTNINKTKTNSVGLSNPQQCHHENQYKSTLLSLQCAVVRSSNFHPIIVKQSEIRQKISSHSIFLHIFLKKASVNCTIARSSITLSDRQGIIDIPLCYLLTSVSSWVYFRLAAQSRVNSSTEKKSLQSKYPQ